MTETNLKLRIEGPGSEETAKELSEFIEKEFGPGLTRVTRKPRQSAGNEPDKSEIETIVVIVLAIPQAISAAMDLRQKIEALIKKARDQKKETPEASANIITDDGQAIPLHKAESDDILGDPPK